MGRYLFRLGNDLLGGAHHGGTAHSDGTGPIGAHAHRHAGRVAVHDINHAFVNTDHLGHHLRKRRLVPLPVAVRPGHDNQPTRGIDPHCGAFIKPCACAQLANKVTGRNAASLDITVDPKAAQFSSRLRGAAARRKTGHVCHLFQLIHGRDIITGVILHRHRRGIGEFGDEVLTPQFDRINTQFMRGLVHQPFQLVGCLRSPGTAIGVNRHGVGEHRFDVHIDQRRAIVAGHQRAMQPRRHRRCEGGQIGTHVGIGIRADRGKVVVRIQRQLNLGDVIAAMGVRHERL